MEAEKIKAAVRERYGQVAQQVGNGCRAVPCGATTTKSCCATVNTETARSYSPEELAGIPEESHLGLGCGNPTALADLQPGMTVVDLGSGAGVDVFLAAQKVGPEGRAIGVDMTPEMVFQAREIAASRGIENAEFRLGEIEYLPVESGTVDRVVSNCVINLAPDKAKVFAEVYRVLKPGGKLTVSDIVSQGEIPPEVRESLEQWAGCVAGAMDREEYLATIRDCGFQEVQVLQEEAYDYGKTADYALLSVTVEATKGPTVGAGGRITCQECRNLLSALVDRELSADELKQVWGHLQECGACCQECAQLYCLDAATTQACCPPWPACCPEGPDDLWERVQGAVAACCPSGAPQCEGGKPEEDTAP